MQPGIYDNIPDDEYHASPGISNSGLVIIANKTPAHERLRYLRANLRQSR